MDRKMKDWLDVCDTLTKALAALKVSPEILEDRQQQQGDDDARETILGVCGSGVSTPDRVPLSLSEMGGPTTGFRRSERTPVEPLVAFKRDANIASYYSWSRGIYHLIYM